MTEGQKAVRFWRGMQKVRGQYAARANRGHAGSMRQLDMMDRYVEAAWEGVKEEADRGCPDCGRLVDLYEPQEADVIPF